MDRQQLLNRIDKQWQALKDSYSGMSEAEMQEPGVTEDWSVKDIIAHMTVWEQEALKHLPLVLAGEKPPKYSHTYGGINSFNAQMIARKRELALTEALRQRDDTHRQLLEYLQTVPEDQIATETRFRRRLRLDTYGHYKIHAEAIYKWRERRYPGSFG